MLQRTDPHGLHGVGYMNLSLENLLDMGPAIVPVMFRGYPDCVVVRGRLGDKVLLADPAFGNRTVDVETRSSGHGRVISAL